MPVLLSSPRSCPLRPGACTCTSVIAYAVKRVEHRHVSGQALLCDHVAHNCHQVVIWQTLSALA